MTSKEAIERLKEGAPFSALYDEAYEEAISLAIKALEERPKGKWIETDRFDEIADYMLKCPKCNEDTLSSHGNFCPNCGADMRGDIWKE